MGWLAEVMARNEKVTGFLAGPFSGTCSGSVPAVESYHGLFRGPSANQHIYMNLDGSALSVIPGSTVGGVIGRTLAPQGLPLLPEARQRRRAAALWGPTLAPRLLGPSRDAFLGLGRSGTDPQRVLMRWYVGAVTPGTSGRSGTGFDTSRHRAHRQRVASGPHYNRRGVGCWQPESHAAKGQWRIKEPGRCGGWEAAGAFRACGGFAGVRVGVECLLVGGRVSLFGP